MSAGQPWPENSGIRQLFLRTWRAGFRQGRVAQAGSAEPKGRSEAPLADPAAGDPPACSVRMDICAASADLKESYERVSEEPAER